MKIEFSWDPETGEALCLIQKKGKVYYGTAICSPEDTDMMNEKTGCYIAEQRAKLMMLRDQRDESKVELRALIKLYSSMNTSKYFDIDSYPIRRLLSHIKQLVQDIEDYKNLIKYERDALTNYIKAKEEFYQKIRQNRKKDKIK